MKNKSNSITEEQKQILFQALESRFEKSKKRFKNLNWDSVQAKILAQPQKLWSLYQMEITGGEPALVAQDTKTNEYTFFDCSIESPKERRSICYDHEALEARKEHKPENSAVQMAEDMGIQLLTEQQYRDLQQLGKFDTKTSSWILTPTAIRKLDGALFADRRYDHVFVYHNGAQSYYGARGFRAALIV